MYSMKKGGSSKSAKQQAAIAISMKAAGKKPKMKKYQPGGKIMTGIGSAYNKKRIRKAVSEGNPNNPPLEQKYFTKSKSGPKPSYSVSIDTTGFASGKKEFPATFKSLNGKGENTKLAGRKRVEFALKNPNVTTFKKGGSAFAKLAPPYNKATYADKIAGAKGAKPKKKMGGSCGTPKSLSKRK